MKIPISISTGLDYELCERTDLGIDAIVKERSELLNLNKRIMQVWHIEALERRLAVLNDRIVEEFLKGYKKK